MLIARAFTTCCLGVALAGLLGCPPPVSRTPAPAEATSETIKLSGASVMIGAGDIASCSSTGDEATARIMDSVMKSNEDAKVENVAYTLGDNVYTSGTISQHINCFGPSWGDSSKRIMKNIRPSPGNHEYNTPGADPYFTFFGDKAGPSGKGYYSYDLGKWHVAVVNSNIIVDDRFTATDRKNMYDWLDKDLTDHTQKCSLVYWHHPLFTSGWHKDDARIRPLWEMMYKHNADVALTGHDHHYERFKPMTSYGVVDTTKGIVEYLVGTGGGELRGLNNVHPGSAARIEGRFGVMMLTLGAEEWRSIFIEADGRVWDSSGGKCH